MSSIKHTIIDAKCVDKGYVWLNCFSTVLRQAFHEHHSRVCLLKHIEPTFGHHCASRCFAAILSPESDVVSSEFLVFKHRHLMGCHPGTVLTYLGHDLHVMSGAIYLTKSLPLSCDSSTHWGNCWATCQINISHILSSQWGIYLFWGEHEYVISSNQTATSIHWGQVR